MRLTLFFIFALVGIVVSKAHAVKAMSFESIPTVNVEYELDESEIEYFKVQLARRGVK